MPKEIWIQFYCFDEHHHTIPIELAEPSPAMLNWAPAIRLIAQKTDCMVLASTDIPDWLRRIVKSERCLLTDNWETTPRVIILLAEMKNLHRDDAFHKIVSTAPGIQIPLRCIKKSDHRNIEAQLRYNCPVIMVGAEDIMDTFTERPDDNIKARTYQYRLDLDPRVKYWDSSIWNRYVPLDGRGDDEKTNFGTRFKAVFDQMCVWYEYGLYETFVALENIEFQTRLMLQSFIAEVGDHGHQERVTPFKFHSETQMEQMSEKIIATLKPTGIWEKIRWRLLLIDDQGATPLSSYLNEKNKPSCEKSKESLIKQQLNMGLGGSVFEIVVTQALKKGHIKSALQMLEKETYDVIMLDYLLGDGKEARNGREYGYDFLRRISHYFDGDNLQEDGSVLHKGPLGRFWIFPVSSFPFAFADKLQQLGMSGYSDYWYLTSGGDPVCTPALFRYKFLSFIKHQVAKCYLYPGALHDFFYRFSNIPYRNLWKNLVKDSLSHINLRREVLRSDEAQKSRFAASMVSFLRNKQEYDSLLDSIKSFVLNIDTISYYKIDDALKAISDEKLRALLKAKSPLFFKEEYALLEAVEKHPNGENTFSFNGGNLRWLPAEIVRLDENGVEVLLLSNNHLRSLPLELSAYINLKQLDLSENELDDLPEWLKYLTNLEYLNLTGNHKLDKKLQDEHYGAAKIQALFDKASPFYSQQKRKVVVSYVPKDKDGLEELEEQLKSMSDQIEYWIDTQILAGEVWDEKVKQKFSAADIILLLLSNSFLASDKVDQEVLKLAMSRRPEDGCHIVPIIWQACHWKHHNFLKNLTALPKNQVALMSAPNRPEAWKDVVTGLYDLLNKGKFPPYPTP